MLRYNQEKPGHGPTESEKRMEFWKKTAPGVLMCLALAVPSWLLGRAFPVIGGPVFAILAGMAAARALKGRARFQAGIAFTSKKVLQYAVILLGFGLNLSELARVGAQSLPIICATITTSLAVAFALCKCMKIPGRISVLVGVGSSLRPLRLSLARTMTKLRRPSRLSFCSTFWRRCCFRRWAAPWA